MAPSNFKTYEAQSRLLAAVLASAPTLKLDFKEIWKHYGESTPQGLEFQFRSIKKDAKALRDAVVNGENPVAAVGKPGPSTPSKRKASATPKTGGSTTAKRQRKKGPSSSDDDDKEVDYEAMDVKTPTKPKPKPKPKAQVENGPTVAAETPYHLSHDNTPFEGNNLNGGVGPIQLDEEPDPLKHEFEEPYVKLENDPLLSQAIDGDWDDMTEGVV
ncbi:hypothetical protein RB595_002811 [Gaeumannomyces hyphopodioides]